MKNEFTLYSTVEYDSFIPRDHLVHGKRVLPGVTLLDLIMRVLSQKGIDVTQFTFSNILFIKPISLEENMIKTLMISVHSDDNKYFITVSSKSKAKTDNESSKWESNLTCELFLELNTLENIDVRELLTHSNTETDLDDIYQILRAVDIKHLEFMKGLGRLYINDEYIIARIDLGELSRQYSKDFFCHPVFLDGSTLIPILANNLDELDKKPYIPIYISKFNCRSRSTDSCYVYIPKKHQYKQSEDIVSNDIYLFDEQFKPIAAFNKISSKRIRNASSIKDLNANTVEDDIKVEQKELV